MKPLCFIGARGGSKGVSNKNIRPIGGKPLIAHAIESSLDSKLFAHVVVSTEDTEIAKIAKKFGAEVPFMRPKRLAMDNVKFSDVMYHGIKKLQSLGYDFEVIANRDCTAPFIRNYDVKRAIRLLGKAKCNCVAAVYRQHLNPYFNMAEKGRSGFLEISKVLKERPQSRQRAPVVYQLNGLYVYDVNKFLKHKTGFPPKTLPLEIPPETGLMIDTEQEFQIARLLVQDSRARN